MWWDNMTLIDEIICKSYLRLKIKVKFYNYNLGVCFHGYNS